MENKLRVDNKYTQMQLNEYNKFASEWDLQNRDPVVGSFDLHNEWKEYENLFLNLQNQKELVGLDWACGPGRNIVKYKDRFKRLDGVDISPININNAKNYLQSNQILNSNLYISNGIDLSNIPDNTYDFVMSTIAFQHICVYDIRYSILSEVYRILKLGGIITFQMGYGLPSPNTVGYYENYYDASSTNRGCDVCVDNPNQIKNDLLKIGFTNFQYTIGNVGPGDIHPNWIYFNSVKL
jgi:ubiquinone/menaquinone biosynthesis C-methylase UbiE